MGDFIAYYRGRKISNAKADQLGTRYLFELNSRWTIDGSNRLNLARYINHSCRANAESDVKKGKIIITARKTIQPDDEITPRLWQRLFRYVHQAEGLQVRRLRFYEHGPSVAGETRQEMIPRPGSD